MRTIKILSKGPIRPMNMIHGPILTPWKVDDNKIRALLRAGIDVVEVLSDGTEKHLTLTDLMQNVQNENEKKENPSKPAKGAPAVTKEPVVEKAPEPETDNVEAVYTAPAEEEVTEETSDNEETTKPNNYQNYNKKHKNNRK